MWDHVCDVQHIKVSVKKLKQIFQEGRWDLFAMILFPIFAHGLFCEGVNVQGGAKAGAQLFIWKIISNNK